MVGGALHKMYNGGGPSKMYNGGRGALKKCTMGGTLKNVQWWEGSHQKMYNGGGPSKMYNGGREAPKQCKMGGDHQKCTMVGGEPPRKYTVPFLEY